MSVLIPSTQPAGPPRPPVRSDSPVPESISPYPVQPVYGMPSYGEPSSQIPSYSAPASQMPSYQSPPQSQPLDMPQAWNPPYPPAELPSSHYPPRPSSPQVHVREPPRSLLLVTSATQQKKHHLTVHHPRGYLGWDDRDLFQGLRAAYDTKLRSVWERCFSLKGLKLIRLLEYTTNTRAVEVEMEAFVLQEIMRFFRDPSELHGSHEWILWIFELKAMPNTRYALEFVSGWEQWKVLIAGAIPWMASVLTAVLWSVFGGNIQNGIAVGSFMLAVLGAVVAMLAFLSTLEK